MHALHKRVFRAGMGEEQKKQKESFYRENRDGRVWGGQIWDGYKIYQKRKEGDSSSMVRGKWLWTVEAAKNFVGGKGDGSKVVCGQWLWAVEAAKFLGEK